MALELGDVVVLPVEGEDKQPLGLLQAVWKPAGQGPQMQVLAVVSALCCCLQLGQLRCSCWAGAADAVLTAAACLGQQTAFEAEL